MGLLINNHTWFSNPRDILRVNKCTNRQKPWPFTSSTDPYPFSIRVVYVVNGDPQIFSYNFEEMRDRDVEFQRIVMLLEDEIKE